MFANQCVTLLYILRSMNGDSSWQSDLRNVPPTDDDITFNGSCPSIRPLFTRSIKWIQSSINLPSVINDNQNVKIKLTNSLAFRCDFKFFRIQSDLMVER